MKPRGNVMVQVLVMAVLLLSLATGLLKVYFQHHNSGVFSMSSTRTRSRVESSLAAAQSTWVASNVCFGGALVDCGNGFSGGSAGPAGAADPNQVCRGFAVQCRCRVVIDAVEYPEVFVCNMGGTPARLEARTLTEYSMQ